MMITVNYHQLLSKSTYIATVLCDKTVLRRRLVMIHHKVINTDTDAEGFNSHLVLMAILRKLI